MTPANRAYWLERSKTFRFHAVAPQMDPTPTEILYDTPDLEFIAVPADHGEAWWAFRTAADATAFIRRWPNASAFAEFAHDGF